MFNEKGDKKEQNYFKLAMKMESNVLVESSPKIINKKTLFISPKNAEYLLENKKRFNIKSNDLQSAIDEFLINLGEYSTHVELNDNVCENKAFISIEKSEILLDYLTKINGEKSYSLYKNEYNKALLKMKKFQSIMWNPHIFEIK